MLRTFIFGDAVSSSRVRRMKRTNKTEREKKLKNHVKMAELRSMNGAIHDVDVDAILYAATAAAIVIEFALVCRAKQNAKQNELRICAGAGCCAWRKACNVYDNKNFI